MAKKSSIEKNDRRKKLSLRYAAKRKAFKAVVRDPKATDAQKRVAQVGMQKLPRNSAPERVRNRCSMTGRARRILSTSIQRWRTMQAFRPIGHLLLK